MTSPLPVSPRALLLSALLASLASCGGGSSSGPSGLSFRGSVSAAVRDDDSWYIGGRFTGAQALPAAGLLAVDASGSEALDCDLGAGFDGPVYAIALSDDAVYVGGAFREYRGAPARALAKLDPETCALDTTFNPPSGPTGFTGYVSALVVSGTSLYVGGQFDTYRGAATGNEVLAKLDVDTGDADASFAQTAAGFAFFGWANALAVAGDALLVGGYFDYSDLEGYGAQNFARFDLATGAAIVDADLVFDDGFDGAVGALSVVGDSVYVGGTFTAYRDEPIPSENLVKLDLASGALDAEFAPFLSGPVEALVAGEAGLFVGGRFASDVFGGGSRAGLVAVDFASGAVVRSFDPVASGGPAVTGESVQGLALAEGVLYVAGQFTGSDPSVNGFVALREESGELVGHLLPRGHEVGGFDGVTYAVATAGERVWVGGGFFGYGGRRASYLVKMDDSTFELDERFASPELGGFDGPVHSLVVAGGALYVGGEFTSYRGVPNSANNLAKLDLRTGELDTTFSPRGESANGVDGAVRSLVVSGDSLFVGGAFTNYRGDSAYGVVKVSLETGAPDPTFSPGGAPIGLGGGDEGVQALALSGGSLFAVGDFTSYLSPALEPTNCVGLAKLDAASGEFVAAFAPAVDFDAGFDTPDLRALVVSEDALYVGGWFGTYGGDPASSIVKLDLVDGALDTTFSPAAANGFEGPVSALALAGDSLYVAGAVDSYRGVDTGASGLVRLDASSGALVGAFFASRGFSEWEERFTALVPDGDALFVGGGFGYYDGETWVSRAAFVDATTGALLQPSE